MTWFATLTGGERPPGYGYLPFLEGLAADMEGVDESAFGTDPTRWANALPRAARLVGARAIVLGTLTPVRRALAAELGGAGDAGSGAVLADTLARLADTQRGERDLAVLLPGVATLLDGGDRAALDALKARLVGLMERLCVSRPALVLVDEDDGPALSGSDGRRLFGTLKNVADYYGVALGLRLSGADPEIAIGARRNLRIDHLLLADPVADPARCLAAAARAGWRSLGLSGMPAALPGSAPGDPGLWFASPGQMRDIDALKTATGAA
ncbi:MAG: hypothetical protein Q7J47_14550 [Azoarcus sp.]|nr:hypothetical protein [Azoarcus sp.]